MINLTQHAATPDQAEAGVVDMPAATRQALQRLLTFAAIPTAREVAERATAIAEMAGESGHAEAMIGGAPFLMAALEAALYWQGIKPFYAFSLRECVEISTPNGVEKRAVFNHRGFVPAGDRDSWT